MFELEDKIVKTLNDTPLPLEAKFYVLQTILLRLRDAIKEEKNQKEDKANE